MSVLLVVGGCTTLDAMSQTLPALLEISFVQTLSITQWSVSSLFSQDQPDKTTKPKECF